jgi:hypothetical protein
MAADPGLFQTGLSDMPELTFYESCFLIVFLLRHHSRSSRALSKEQASRRVVSIEMGDSGNSVTTQPRITSHEHEEILDTIDKIREQGISRYVDIPQIVVCGDQSSGK